MGHLQSGENFWNFRGREIFDLMCFYVKTSSQKLVLQVDSWMTFYGKLSALLIWKDFLVDGRGMSGRGEDCWYFLLEDVGLKCGLKTGFHPYVLRHFFSGDQTGLLSSCMKFGGWCHTMTPCWRIYPIHMYHIDDIPSMHDVGRQHGHHWPFYPIALQRPLHDGILFALRLRTNSPILVKMNWYCQYSIGSSNPKEPRCCFSW